MKRVITKGYSITTVRKTRTSTGLVVSTIAFPHLPSHLDTFKDARYETCVFDVRDSEVLERYSDGYLARQGHDHWVKLIETREWGLEDLRCVAFELE